MSPRNLLTAGILNATLLLLIGWAIVNFACSGNCGGSTPHGAPWSP